MSNNNSFKKAAAARTGAAVGTGTGNQTGPRGGAQRSTMVTTVEVPRHTRAKLDIAFTGLKLEHDRKVALSPVTVVLYDLFLDNVTMLDDQGNPIDLQEEVMRRL